MSVMKRWRNSLLLLCLIQFSTSAIENGVIFYRSGIINDDYTVKVTRVDASQRLTIHKEKKELLSLDVLSDIKRFDSLKVTTFKQDKSYAFILWDKGAHSKILSIYNLSNSKLEKEIKSHMLIDVKYQFDKVIITYDESLKSNTLEGRKKEYIFTP